MLTHEEGNTDRKITNLLLRIIQESSRYFWNQVNRIYRLKFCRKKNIHNILFAPLITVKYMNTSLSPTKPSKKHREKKKQIIIFKTYFILSFYLNFCFLLPSPLTVKISLSSAKDTTISTRTKTRRALTFILVSAALRFVGRLEISSDFCLNFVEF